VRETCTHKPMIRFHIDVDPLTTTVTNVHAFTVHDDSVRHSVAADFIEQPIEQTNTKQALTHATALTRSVSTAVGTLVFEMIERERQQSIMAQRRIIHPLPQPVRVQCVFSSDVPQEKIAHCEEDLLTIARSGAAMIVITAAHHLLIRQVFHRCAHHPPVFIHEPPGYGLSATCLPAKAPRVRTRYTPCISLECDEDADALV
jgi:hypothetical protein